MTHDFSIKDNNTRQLKFDFWAKGLAKNNNTLQNSRAEKSLVSGQLWDPQYLTAVGSGSREPSPGRGMDCVRGETMKLKLHCWALRPLPSPLQAQSMGPKMKMMKSLPSLGQKAWKYYPPPPNRTVSKTTAFHWLFISIFPFLSLM